jgi:hypothetical protein
MNLPTFLTLLTKTLGILKGRTLHRITELYTQRFSICPNVTSKIRTIAIFKD